MLRNLNTLETPFDGFFNRIFQYEPLTSDSFRTLPVKTEIPLDIASTDEAILVRASLPGFSKEEIDVQLHEGYLTINAEHQTSENAENEKTYLQERFTGNLKRRVRLPNIINGAATRADFCNGILTIQIAIPESIKPQKIKIGSTL